VDLTPIETYYDAVPRVSASTEEIGPFTLFLASEGTGWDFYARPRLGVTEEFTAADVHAVLARQTELGKPHAIEWVDQITPSLLPAVRAALPEATIEECPLLVLPVDAVVPVAGPGRYVELAADDPDLGWVSGAQDAAFGEHDDVADKPVGRRPELITDGFLVVVAAYDESGRVIGGGSASPRGDTTELMGIATVRSARRQGHGSAITAALVEAARRRGVRQVFLAAASDDAASIYRALGFERVGTACILEG
jgi:ribosomal protein S18 acetylase RimI-like enzyme